MHHLVVRKPPDAAGLQRHVVRQRAAGDEGIHLAEADRAVPPHQQPEHGRSQHLLGDHGAGKHGERIPPRRRKRTRERIDDCRIAADRHHRRNDQHHARRRPDPPQHLALRAIEGRRLRLHGRRIGGTPHR
jgi:hypothetical protein